MLEKISQLAERSATRASRRQFLGNVGRGAMVLAAMMGGLTRPARPRGGGAARRVRAGLHGRLPR
jgi:hypothetical protein